jgi:hypothetical protein
VSSLVQIWLLQRPTWDSIWYNNIRKKNLQVTEHQSLTLRSYMWLFEDFINRKGSISKIKVEGRKKKICRKEKHNSATARLYCLCTQTARNKTFHRDSVLFIHNCTQDNCLTARVYHWTTATARKAKASVRDCNLWPQELHIAYTPVGCHSQRQTCNNFY